MGKRIEKAFGKDRGQGSNSTQDNHDDDPNKTPEPYNCTGHFASDFAELCRRNSMVVAPPVVMRPHRPPSPSQVAPADEKQGKGKGKDDKKNQPAPEPEPEIELDENGEPKEPPPKTYVTKEKFEFFKPCVQVEMDHPEKLDTVTELYVRGWCVDEPMMNIFRQCWPRMDRLHTVSLWSTGLTDETLGILANFLPECSNLKNLQLDNNPVKEEQYHLLIKEESPIQNLSLRYNGITEKGAALLGEALGTAKKSNTKLLSLNLNGNKISDRGAEHLANGLRMNRTLLSLSLSNNQIGDAGATKLAEVVSKIFLNHEEIVERRKLLSEKGSPERQKSPVTSKRADSRDRPGSRSSHPDKSKGKSAKKKDEKGGTHKEKEDKHDKTKGKKDQDKTLKKDGRGSKASVVGDSKAATKKTEKGKKQQKGHVQQEQEPEAHETINPLLSIVDRVDGGKLMICGNLALISLNLSHNMIGEEGMRKILEAIDYQTTSQMDPDMKRLGPGLMRMVVHRNSIPMTHEIIQRIQEKMVPKDPFYKPASDTPDMDRQSKH